jgi:hypothetical protein
MSRYPGAPPEAIICAQVVEVVRICSATSWRSAGVFAASSRSALRQPCSRHDLISSSVPTSSTGTKGMSIRLKAGS